MIAITFVNRPRCPDCTQARLILSWAQKEFPDLEVQSIPLGSSKSKRVLFGNRLVELPAVFINDVLFSSGPIDKADLVQTLKEVSRASE